ncbi:chitin disaccharide deacetylase [Neobacillus soli]|uniref:chitin disaccharide deacetylase n=1 Tax=Neobacillus soli TaxID=220688 RepID=UPI0008243DD1|nr:chitin disaccharide deacetylase [Neobacillus soli]
MIKLIVNADDFGLSRGVNYGILDSYLYGIVNSTTMMMNMGGTEHAIQLAKNNPELRVGIHLVLTGGKPLTENVPSLVGKDGYFKSLSDFNNGKDLSLAEVEKEWKAQFERFISSGLRPTHFDSHHHVHILKELQPVVQKLSETYGLPVRRNGGKAIEGTASFSDLSLIDFYGEGVTESYFTNLSAWIEDGQTVEIMCHPAYLDHVLLNGSSYNVQRLIELEILTTVKLPGNLVLLKNN